MSSENPLGDILRCWSSRKQWHRRDRTPWRRYVTPEPRRFRAGLRARHQVDNNLVLEGSRTFKLLNPAWDHPHHIIHLIRAMGALQIPIGTYHRSMSSEEGSWF